jgi:hypothetical protein
LDQKKFLRPVFFDPVAKMSKLKKFRPIQQVQVGWFLSTVVLTQIHQQRRRVLHRVFGQFHVWTVTVGVFAKNAGDPSNEVFSKRWRQESSTTS